MDTITDRKRQIVSRNTGCSFAFNAAEARDEDGGGWDLRHQEDMRHASHNHEPTTNIHSFWQHRQIKGQALEHVTVHASAHVKPHNIVDFIHKETTKRPTAQDIKSLLHRKREKELLRRTPIQALLERMTEDD